MSDMEIFRQIDGDGFTSNYFLLHASKRRSPSRSIACEATARQAQ